MVRNGALRRSSIPIRHGLRHALVFAMACLACAAPGVARADDAAALAAPRDPASQARAIKRAMLARRLRGYFECVAERDRMLNDEGEDEADDHVLPGEHLRPAPWEPSFLAAVREPAALPANLADITSVPPNIRVNDPFPDNATSTQSETGLASVGPDVLVAWNDGEASFTGGDYIGYGYSVNGGQTFKDGGTPPHPAGYLTWRWTSDPTVSVNEKTGRFYLAATASIDATHNAIGVAMAHFSDTLLVWDNVVVAASALNSSAFLDKPWITADSSGAGYVYLSNSTFIPGSDRIDFRRSTDGGTTWSAATLLSNALDNGYVQGSRPAVGPAGEVYVVWEADRPDTTFDHIKIRKSVNHGVSFATETIITNYYRNDGTGGPGFNRQIGISFPSIAVDRTFGTYRGRVYVAWNESYDWLDNNPFGGSIHNEVEPDNAASTAIQFTPGEVLRGSTAYVLPTSAPDIDWWKFNLIGGQAIIVYVDSIVSGQTYSLRIQAPGADSSQRLAYSGDDDPSDGVVDGAIYTFMAPSTGTYYLRFSPLSGTTSGGSPFTGVTGNYRIRTRLGNTSGRARDQRDIFLSFSSDGGTTWFTPSRVNNDPIGYDDFLPEVGVGPDGMPYVQWYDFRDDNYGSRTHQYFARSSNGGGGWLTNQRVTTTPGNFTLSASNIQPNMGDYGRMWADERWMHSGWGDARSTNVDTWTARFDAAVTFTRPCPPDTSVAADRIVVLDNELINSNVLANDYKVKVTSQRNWKLPDSLTINIPAGGSLGVPFQILVPDTAHVGTNLVCLKASTLSGVPAIQCCRTVTITPRNNTTGVETPALELALRPITPNPAMGPARIAYSLARTGLVRLTVYGLQGERVRTLVDGWRPAGSGNVEWDGRDGRGTPAGAGVYFVQLETAGEHLTRRVVRLR